MRINNDGKSKALDGSAKTHPVKRRRVLLVAIVVAIALSLDLATKLWARVVLPSPAGLDPLPFLALRPRFNAGTTFGILTGNTDSGLLILVAVTVLAIATLAWWAVRTRDTRVALGAALMAAGALGNLIDRMLVGMVTDFIGIHFGGWYSPIFNLADGWLIVGLIIVLSERRRRRAGPASIKSET